MFVDESCIEALGQLNNVDHVLFNAQRAANELPQRAELTEIAQKKQTIRQKYDQISKLHDSFEKEIARLEEQIDLTRQRMTTAQAAIDEAGEDFRQVESLANDLNGLNEQVEEMETTQLDYETKKQSIEDMFGQIDAALKTLLDRESALKQSLAAEVEKIKAFVAERQGMRAEACKNIPANVLDLYQRTVKKCGGVALCRLEDGTCTVCRQKFEPGKVHAIQDEAPLTVCPSCGRMMVVED